MALTAEEQRALAFNLSLEKRRAACRNRAYLLTGNAGAKQELTDRVIAVTKEQNSEQRQKVRYDERDEPVECGVLVANG